MPNISVSQECTFHRPFLDLNCIKYNNFYLGLTIFVLSLSFSLTLSDRLSTARDGDWVCTGINATAAITIAAASFPFTKDLIARGAHVFNHIPVFSAHYELCYKTKVSFLDFYATFMTPYDQWSLTIRV